MSVSEQYAYQERHLISSMVYIHANTIYINNKVHKNCVAAD